MLFVHDERVVGEVRFQKKHIEELFVDIALFLSLRFPLALVLREIAQYDFPAILSQQGCFVGDALRQECFELAGVNYLFVEDIHEPRDFLGNNGRQPNGVEMCDKLQRLCFSAFHNYLECNKYILASKSR